MTFTEATWISNGVLYLVLGVAYTYTVTRYQRNIWPAKLSSLVCTWFALCYFLMAFGWVDPRGGVLWAFRIGVWLYVPFTILALRMMTQAAPKRKRK